MGRIERVVVDECVGQESSIVEELHRRLGDELPIAFVFLAAGHPGFPISKFAGNEFVPVDLQTIASALGDGAAPENAAAGPLPGGRQG